MITGEDIERAERILSVVYDRPLPQQLEMVAVDGGALDDMVEYGISIIKRRYPDAWGSVDPRLEPALNTIIAHCFLVGVIAGRNSERVIE